MTGPRDAARWSVVTPVMLFLVGQLILAIWWASAQTQVVAALQADQADFRQSVEVERRRMSARIDQNQAVISAVMASSQATAATLAALQQSVAEMRSDMREVIRLMRDGRAVD